MVLFNKRKLYRVVKGLSKKIKINRFVLQECGYFTWRVSDSEELVGVTHRRWCEWHLILEFVYEWINQIHSFCLNKSTKSFPVSKIYPPTSTVFAYNWFIEFLTIKPLKSPLSLWNWITICWGDPGEGIQQIQFLEYHKCYYFRVFIWF